MLVPEYFLLLVPHTDSLNSLAEALLSTTTIFCFVLHVVLYKLNMDNEMLQLCTVITASELYIFT